MPKPNEHLHPLVAAILQSDVAKAAMLQAGERTLNIFQHGQEVLSLVEPRANLIVAAQMMGIASAIAMVLKQVGVANSNIPSGCSEVHGLAALVSSLVTEFEAFGPPAERVTRQGDQPCPWTSSCP